MVLLNLLPPIYGKHPYNEGCCIAERAGFEPANLCGLHAFQACALSQLRDLSVRRANYTRK